MMDVSQLLENALGRWEKIFEGSTERSLELCRGRHPTTGTWLIMHYATFWDTGAEKTSTYDSDYAGFPWAEVEAAITEVIPQLERKSVAIQRLLLCNGVLLASSAPWVPPEQRVLHGTWGLELAWEDDVVRLRPIVYEHRFERVCETFTKLEWQLLGSAGAPILVYGSLH